MLKCLLMCIVVFNVTTAKSRIKLFTLCCLANSALVLKVSESDFVHLFEGWNQKIQQTKMLVMCQRCGVLFHTTYS